MSPQTEIVDRFISDILSGKYKANDRLPSENELANQYRIPRMTARKAYERLQELGYIYSIQGKGSYVKDRSKQIELVLSGDESFSQKMLDKGYNFETRNIFCKPIEYNKEIFDFLRIEPNDQACKVGRLRFVDHRPIALHMSYIAKSVFPDIDRIGMEITSMFGYYKSKGFSEFSSTKSILSVSFPTEFERELLECTSLVPLLVLETGTMDKTTGIVLEYTKILYRSDSFSYIVP